MSQDNRRLSDGDDIGSENNGNTNLIGESLRDYSNPSRSASLLGSPPTNTNNNTTGQTKLTNRKSYARSNEDDVDDDDDDNDDNDDNSRRKGLRRRASFKSRKSTNDDMSENEDNDVNDADNESLSGSDREFTLKERQDAINITHPFGLRLWKAALYKKSRSVTRDANSALHSTPSPDLYLYPGNILWAIGCGWWLALISFIVSIFLLVTPGEGYKYARVLRELSYYIFWPFGKYVERQEVEDEEWFAADEDLRIRQRQQQERVENMNHNDFFIARDTSIITDVDSVTTDEDVNSESRPLLGRTNKYNSNRKGRKDFNLFKIIKEIGFAGVVFYFWFFLIIVPVFLFVSAMCWLCVFSIPMAKLTFLLCRHLRLHPLSLHFKPGSSLKLLTNERSLILLCTYKAFGIRYYKYTYDGINIIFINLMPLVFFVIIDFFLFPQGKYFISSPGFIFTLSLVSVIPLSYLIGMAVASISAQSSAGLGAVINATFGSIIEVILYALALTKGRGKVAEGSIIGSVMAGVLLMPGISMISGGFKRKEQRFNAKSAGVTSTMLIMAIIGTLTPTLFFQTYAPYKMTCKPCEGYTELSAECQICTHDQVDPTSTPLYKERVKPLMFFCAFILVFSYLIGLWFTLRTHASLVWQTGHHSHTNLQSAPIKKQIQQLLLHPNPHANSLQQPLLNNNNIHSTPTTSLAPQRPMSAPSSSLNTHAHNMHDLTHVTATLSSQNQHPQIPIRFAHEPEEEEEPGGHDSPNWGKIKSGVVLLSCTAFYSIIAEILVQNVEVVLDNVTISEKLLGLTLFALVPNVTEFVNAMSFALHGNIALSMEIGSAYALQVCLLQIPSMVAFSAWYNAGKPDGEENLNNTFTLVFPRWDIFSVIFPVFLLTYTYIEGKSNYFKGSILILSYLVLMAGFYYADDADKHY
ncbi:Sodium/calcium exchanger protein [Glomus cerebriforme]|uniref:Sodium/calcium exchanger protein n=1 Tax=Glomus cerebriforme TaxID=658196 RepID=A0A397T326_9GLOM|nr:Sodium/calcium exchanger protein [Glomus cerebriforme]